MILVVFIALWVGVLAGFCLSALFLRSKEEQAFEAGYDAGHRQARRLHSGTSTGPLDLVA